jgi:hypothetical protein
MKRPAGTVTVLVLAVAGCDAKVDPEKTGAPTVAQTEWSTVVNHKSTATYSQVVNLGSARVVRIKCFCSKRSVDRTAASASMTLEVTGQFVISGYFGPPGAGSVEPLSPKKLEFKVDNSGKEIVVSSPEWAHIHHSLTISSITVRVPPAVEVIFEDIPYDSLEDREPGA